MEVAKLSALPNLEVRFVSCNESAIKRWLSSELEETVFSLTHELFMTKHHTVTLIHFPQHLDLFIGQKMSTATFIAKGSYIFFQNGVSLKTNIFFED